MKFCLNFKISSPTNLSELLTSLANKSVCDQLVLCSVFFPLASLLQRNDKKLGTSMKNRRKMHHTRLLIFERLMPDDTRRMNNTDTLFFYKQQHSLLLHTCNPIILEDLIKTKQNSAFLSVLYVAKKSDYKFYKLISSQ